MYHSDILVQADEIKFTNWTLIQDIFKSMIQIEMHELSFKIAKYAKYVENYKNDDDDDDDDDDEENPDDDDDDDDEDDDDEDDDDDDDDEDDDDDDGKFKF